MRPLYQLFSRILQSITTICHYSYPYDEGVLAGPNTQTTHLSLSSKARSPSQATYRVWGINWSHALTSVVAAILHRSVFIADIEASTLSGHSVIDATMAPDNY